MPSALITGGDRGFGRDLAEVYAARGWEVFPLVRDAGAAAQLCFCLGASCHPIVGELASGRVEREISAVLARNTESLDVLVNAGAAARSIRDLEFARPDELDDLFRVTCTGPLRCARAALPFLRNSRRAIVATIVSRSFSVDRPSGAGNAGIYPLQIARSAHRMLSAWLDQELRGEGVRVFTVHLGRLAAEIGTSPSLARPREPAVRLADWLERAGCGAPCWIGDPTGGRLAVS